MSENIKKITEYLRENKSSFSREQLTDTLLKAGYGSEDLDQGLKSVYENQPVQIPSAPPAKSGFWDFQTKKTYFDSTEKWLDILFGFGISILLAGLTSIIPVLGILFFYAVIIFLIVFFSSRRMFIVVSLAMSLFLGPIIAGVLVDLIGRNYFLNNSFF
jgi:hypothetical protein